ncbi:CheR family methyltransferase [Rhodocytophaga aerolata]|uniref:CheR family methyltransferase n=1 Tax=Rhodocytophaga aerolata TaxID=455078 RepID=A0ABT8RH36_9BACT|nr:chemotaxis protein CheB [Rhodocytophaga aerolata]MDO1450669.1 CheR family methyltransferase [Rhodocytophaga aerolata]
MVTHSSPQHIIAIGASAGGIEAIYTFFDHTPLDKASYIIIQHLSPHHQSRLTQLLEKHSKLDIALAENGMVVEPNKIYVIPNKQFMTLQNGTLYLTSKAGKKGPHQTINTFFNALANDQADKAIGIILSGMGSDGSEGVKAIKNAGGLVIVQDPKRASYDSMPTQALATGMADWVLSPEEMPMRIQAYVHQLHQHTPLNPAVSPTRPDKKDESTLIAVLDLLKSKLPLDFSDYKRATIFRRIRKRMAHHGVSDSKAYLQMLSNNPIELEALAQDFLISVTSFFRDREAFELLERDVIPAIMNGEEEVKIWVAGCATGEEAYSIAILVQEHLDQTKKKKEVKIFATDLDKTALAVASKGVYPESIAGEVLKKRLDRYFIHQDQTYRIKPELRKMLIFAPHNLGKNPPYANMDLISCRNLLIYMNKDLQEKIFSMLHFGLKKGGFLFLGASENTTLLHAHMEEISRKWKIYKKKEHVRPIRFDTFSLPSLEQGKLLSLPSAKGVEVPVGKPALGEVLSEILISEYGGAGVCVDENLQVVDSFGELTQYLLPKVFNFNLLELLPQTLALPVRAALQRAVKSGQNVGIRSKPIKTKHKKASQEGKTIDVLVKPFSDRHNGKRLLLVLFRENSQVNEPNSQPGEKGVDASLQTREYVESLEEELKTTKEQLQATQEKLEAMEENMLSFNEELLSANEEMQSTNEEMQSSNEELQSVNEELQNVNSEFQGKIKELTELNDDLNNYFRSNVNGQLFVDRELKVKKFSPSMVDLINLQERDIGRPLDDITTNIKFETFREDMTKVIAEGGIIVKEVQSGHKCYQVMTMPYIRQRDTKIDGAILTFYEITELKRLQKELEERNKHLLRINEELDTFVYSASHDLLGPIAHIQGLIELIHIKNDQLNPEAEEFYRMIDKAIAKFRALIRELSVIGKIDHEGLQEGEEINFEELVEEIKLSIGTQLSDTQTKIESEFEVLHIHFAKKNLRSILYNLITNAIKYKSLERAPRIVIRTKMLSGFILLCVEDNGMGMEENKIASIFTLYKRLNEQVEGQGIGLYLTQRIIHEAGGHIEVESNVGKGTTFKLYFKQ